MMESRIDRIYISDTIQHRKQGAGTVAAAFIDHFAVIVHMVLEGTSMLRRVRLWRMNITVLEESSFREIIKGQCGKWQRYIQYYPNKVIWWDKYVKWKIQRTFQRECAERNGDRRALENCYYIMIYRVIRHPSPQAEKAVHLRNLKAKITDFIAHNR
jgi:hypothetical protein